MRLENRRVVESGLGPVVEEISVSPTVVKKIVDGPIDEAWVRALAEVDKRAKALDSKAKEHRDIKGISDLRPLLENLIHKVLDVLHMTGEKADFKRQLKESEISWLHKSRHYDLRISMLRLYSSCISCGTKSSMHFYIDITSSWQKRSARPT